MPEPARHVEELRAGTRLRVGSVTLIPIERVVVSAGTAGSAAWFTAVMEPFALVVRDDFQNLGIGHEVLSYLTLLARKQGLLGFTAEVLVENTAMLHLFEKQGFDIQKRSAECVFELQMMFGGLV